MIKNTYRYNAANYESLHTDWEKRIEECRLMCMDNLNEIGKLLEMDFEKAMNKNTIPTYKTVDDMHEKFDIVHRDNWVTPIINLNNDMFKTNHNPLAMHLIEGGLNGLRAYLHIPPTNEQEMNEILEYMERFQPILDGYKKAMKDIRIIIDETIKNF